MERTLKITGALEALGKILPGGTELSWEDRTDPDVLIVTAWQPHPEAGQQYKAAVQISREAEQDDGLGQTLAEALRALQHRALTRSLPVARTDEPAPVVAVRTTTGLEQQDPPLRGPSPSWSEAGHVSAAHAVAPTVNVRYGPPLTV
jgi:hypothetical protein